jgi:predicted nucleic acid-binding protein
LREIDRGRALGYDLPDVHLLSWVELRTPSAEIPATHPAALGAGERAVIEIAATTLDALVLLDDELARRFARGLGLRVTETLGVLLKAKQEGLLPEIKPILDQLDTLGFRVSASTRTAVLKLAAEANDG